MKGLTGIRSLLLADNVRRYLPAFATAHIVLLLRWRRVSKAGDVGRSLSRTKSLSAREIDEFGMDLSKKKKKDIVFSAVGDIYRIKNIVSVKTLRRIVQILFKKTRKILALCAFQTFSELIISYS